MTKDEKLLVEIYKALQKSETADPYALGEKLGFREKLVGNIVRLLQQANFVKQHAPNEVILTPHGINLAKSLIK